jgi:hypothetical protein
MNAVMLKTLTLADFEIVVQITPQKAEFTFELKAAIVAQLASTAKLTYSGRVRGPDCVFSQTLAANYPIKAAEKGGIASATIPDFCHWSAALPFTYDLGIEMKGDDQVVARVQATLASHWIRLQHGKLYQASKRWVPRLTSFPRELGMASSIDGELIGWLKDVRLQDLALVIKAEDATEALLSACQTYGVPVAISCSGDQAALASRWQTFACVFMLLLGGGRRQPLDTRLLLATAETHVDLTGVTRWGIRRADAPRDSPSVGYLVARGGVHTLPTEARFACDRLQAETAAIQDWAGYFA